MVNTLVTYLARYRDFDDAEQMKRVVGLIHRQVIKAQAEGLYFRVGSRLPTYRLQSLMTGVLPQPIPTDTGRPTFT